MKNQENSIPVSNQKIKNIYIHIGLHKTATSSIQHTLWQNKELLKDHGVFFPSNWKRNHGIVMQTMFSSPEFLTKKTEYIYYVKANLNSMRKIASFASENKKNIKKEILNTNCNTVVFSGESISMMNKTDLIPMKLFLKTMMPLAKITVVIFVREKSAFASSYYQQDIKAGLNAVIRLHEKLYQETIEKFSRVFSKENMKVVSFEKSLKHPHGPVGEFLNIIGLPENEIDKVSIKRANLGISDKAIELVAYINKQLPLTDRTTYRAGRYKKDSHGLHAIQGKKFSLPQKIQAEIWTKGREDNLWLKKHYGIDYIKKFVVQNEQQEIIYDQQYLKDIKDYYDDLSIVLKKIVYNFMLMKKDIMRNAQSQTIICEIIDWIEINNASLVNQSLSIIISKQEKNQRRANRDFKNAVKNLIKDLISYKK